MSTKATIYLDKDFHLYQDSWGDNHVYLEIETQSRFVEKLAIKIPVSAWNQTRKGDVRPRNEVGAADG